LLLRLFATTPVVAELVLLALAMLMLIIVAVVALSIQHLAPMLVGKTMQFAFVAHAFR
jgi:hypothetical protein